MIKIFTGGGGGGSSEGCLKWGSGGWGSLSLQKHLKTGVGEGKSCSWGGGVEGGKSCSWGGLKVSPPMPPPENFNHTLVRVVFVQALNECVMYVSCMYHECIRNVS